jgi:hypothetical protein
MPFIQDFKMVSAVSGSICVKIASQTQSGSGPGRKVATCGVEAAGSDSSLASSLLSASPWRAPAIDLVACAQSAAARPEAADKPDPAADAAAADPPPLCTLLASPCSVLSCWFCCSSARILRTVEHRR